MTQSKEKPRTMREMIRDVCKARVVARSGRVRSVASVKPGVRIEDRRQIELFQIADFRQAPGGRGLA